MKKSKHSKTADSRCLQLDKEKLRVLQPDDLGEVEGGWHPPAQPCCKSYDA